MGTEVDVSARVTSPSEEAADAPSLGVPNVAGGQDHPLDPKTVLAARLTAAIWVGAVSVASLVAVIVVTLMDRLGGGLTFLVFGGWVAQTAVLSALCYVWPGVQYQHTGYRLDARGLTIRRGVVWRSVTSVPTSRVQHTDVSQGPVQRAFDLATLVLHTAGTQNASVSLSGLPHAVALRLRDVLIDGRSNGGI